MVLETILALVLVQPPTTVTVLIGWPDQREVKMTVVEAERLHRTTSDEGLRAALTAALGTLPKPPKCITWEQHVAEVTSWWAAPERQYIDCSDPRVVPR